MKVAGGPKDAQHVGDTRITKGVYCDDGSRFVIRDKWKFCANPHRLLRANWTGSTNFIFDPVNAADRLECKGARSLDCPLAEGGCEDMYPVT